MNKEEKKNYRIMPSLHNGTLAEWEAFNPYSMCSAYIKQSRIYNLSLVERKFNRTQKKG